MRTIDTIYMHHSESDWGSAKEIDRWHKARGWRGIGYHFVVLNGRPRSSGEYIPDLDGSIEHGRPITQMGAHVLGHNNNSVGICLIGGAITQAQVDAAVKLCRELLDDYPSITAILGHNEAPGASTECPGALDMPEFREQVFARPCDGVVIERDGDFVTITIPRERIPWN